MIKKTTIDYYFFPKINFEMNLHQYQGFKKIPRALTKMSGFFDAKVNQNKNSECDDVMIFLHEM